MGDTMSALPCESCGQHHRLGEFTPTSKVVFVESKRRRSNHLVAVGEVGTVIEWGQYGGPLYYRVEFSYRQRENFDPCELKKDGPKRFFRLSDADLVFYTIVALDLEHAKTIIRRVGAEFSDGMPFDKATDLEWQEISAEKATDIRCHTQDSRGVIPLTDLNLCEWMCSEW